MREFQERRRIKKLLHSRYVIAALAVVCLLLVHAVWGVYQKYQRSSEIARRAAGDLASLTVRQDSLQQSIDSLATPEGKEREIRDTYGVIKPGEKMVVIVDETTTGDQSGDTLPKSWWARFVGIFGF